MTFTTQIGRYRARSGIFRVLKAAWPRQKEERFLDQNPETPTFPQLAVTTTPNQTPTQVYTTVDAVFTCQIQPGKFQGIHVMKSKFYFS